MEIDSTDEMGNFFFGFHDLIPWNSNGNRLATLRIADISTPPKTHVFCDFGFIENRKFIKLGETYAYNFPQGARQQWVGNSNFLIINDKFEDKWISKVYDTDSLRQTSLLQYPAHVITDDGWAFGLNYSRLFRVGGYGYTGLRDITASHHAPSTDGIIKHNIYTGESHLLVSIHTVASFEANLNAGKHHYITHLVLNPNQDRIAFLHRCKLSDGGETTRLMTIGCDGSNLRCLSSGFLSHFDWKNNYQIAIWGRVGTNIEAIRNSIFYRIMPTKLLFFIKYMVKSLISNYYPRKTLSSNSLFNWLVFSDEDSPTCSLLADGILSEDGHPSFCPTNRDWMICDTYPNTEGIRTLYLFQYSTQRKIDLGYYKMISNKPDLASLGDSLENVEASVIKSFKLDNLAFTRSGLHCDLHPRWNRNGTTVSFDSIHEGVRRIYEYNVGSIV
ncbi:hypothetical protein [Salmonirosea aquatica]|uniref:Uncharacterized protein n=1 Tax=Salmonirosea aquatica TaxID=2654236 RepID=A0A7C9FAZ7_9BACT|nr:hypothetical protein [Cytophagaceae bacterium SJW1-29]